MIWSMQSSFQAAIFRRPRRLARPQRSLLTRLRTILRRRARLRAAVRSRTRLSSSRKVTSSTQCKAFPMLQCRRMGLDQDGGIIAATAEEVADLGLDLTSAGDAADRLD